MKLIVSIITCSMLCLLPVVSSGNTDSPLPSGIKVDRLLVEKGKRQLTVFGNDRKLKTYKISLGRKPEGAKEQEGDKKTPEGSYTIDFKKPDSDYHLALHISYPNEEDTERAERQGVSPGSAIMIHGMPNGFDWLGGYHRYVDWTQGCIAVTNAEIEELWRVVPEGTPIEIKP